MTGYGSLVDKWRDSNRVALTTDTDTLTYRDWSDRGRVLARSLVAMGLERPARVAVALPNGADFAVALYACAVVGVTLVPLSTWASGGELRRILTAADPQVVITSDFLGTQRDSLIALADEGVGPGRDRYVNLTPGSALRPLDELLELAAGCTERTLDRARRAGSDDADLVILYTSGSTGQPKGVILGQGTVRRNGLAISRRMGLDGSSRVYSYFPMFFSGGLCNALTGAAAVGAELVTQAKYDPESAARLIRDRACTARNVWHDGMETIASTSTFAAVDLARMRRGLLVDLSLFERFDLPFDEGVNMYGMTETATAFTMHDHRESAELRMTTHGTLLPGNDLRIAEPGTGALVPVGEEGEICIRGSGMMRGYTDGSELAFTDEEGYFHTGDLGFTDDIGHLHYTGRLKTLIKMSGLTVQPEEVEAVLLGHPAVRQAAVVGLGSGDESNGLAALVVTDYEIPPADLERHCRNELSSYKVPRILVVPDRQFPLSASLKIDRQSAAVLVARMI